MFDTEQAFEAFLLAHGGVVQVFQGLVYPVGGGGPIPDVAAFTPGPAFTPRMARAVMPQTGVLHDLSVFVATTSGNVSAAVYDTGDALAGSRTLLWQSGSVAAGAANSWLTIGDPNLPVVMGQHLDLGVMVDNGTVSLGRVSAPIANSAVILPPNFLQAPGGALGKLSASGPAQGSLVWPATFSEAQFAGQQSIYAMLARVVT